MIKPKLLLVIADSSKTGAPSQVRLLATGLKSDYDVSCCCPEGWLKNELKKSGLTVYPWPNGGFRAEKRALSALYRKVDPDLIHCHGVRAGIIGRLAERSAKAKIIYTEHLWTENFRLKNPFRQWLQLFLLRQAGKRGDWTVAVSKAVKRFLIPNHLAYSGRTSVIYGAIEPIEGRPNQNSQIIGTLGRLTWVKGIPTLLKATSYIVGDTPTSTADMPQSIIEGGQPSLICRIGGDGPEMATYQRLAERLGVQKHCQWLGVVSDATTFFNGLSIYVQPSISESFGLAAGEAMSAGIPVIVSRVGGLPELVDDKQTGLIFPAGDAKALAALIDQLLTDRALYQRLSRAGQERARSFSTERFLAEHRKLYNNLTHELAT